MIERIFIINFFFQTCHHGHLQIGVQPPRVEESHEFLSTNEYTQNIQMHIARLIFLRSFKPRINDYELLICFCPEVVRVINTECNERYYQNSTHHEKKS